MCRNVPGYGCDERAEGTGGSEKAEVAEYTIRNTFISKVTPEYIGLQGLKIPGGVEG